jgi:MFS family permease
MLGLSPRERKAIFMASLGSVLEFYDFIVFGFMTNYFIKDIFGNNSLNNNNILILYSIFIIGYIMHPLGMHLYSKIAPVQDLRLVDGGITLMLVISTLTMGLIPTHVTSSIWWMPLLTLGAARVIQGLACGAEMQAELDHIKIKLPQSMSFAALGILAGNEIGQFLAIVVNRILNYGFSPSQIQEYAWRLPFIFGAILALLIYLVRLKFAEPVDKEHCHRNIIPVYKLFNYYPSQTFIAIGLAGLRGAVMLLYLIFIPFTMHHFLNYSLLNISRVIFITSILGAIAAYLINRFCSFHNAPRQLFICVTLLFPGIILWAMSFHYNKFVYITILAISTLSSCFTFLVQRVMAGLFPSAVRLAGVSFANQQGYIFCAGFMPLISIALGHLLLSSHLYFSHHLVFYIGIVFYILILVIFNIYGLYRLPHYANYTDIHQIRQKILAKHKAAN